MNKLDPTKPVRTRDGKPARIICTDAKSSYPIVALVMLTNENRESICFYKEDGLYNGIEDHENDLVNITKKITKIAYIVMRQTDDVLGWYVYGVQQTETDANELAEILHDRVVVVPVTVEFEV